MHIEAELLFTWGAVAKRIEKGEALFREGEMPRFYHQILEGRVKMYNINDEGKMFFQGMFGPGESFGEPPLLIQQPYPATAEAAERSVVLRLGKDVFMRLLDEYPSLKDDLLQLLACRLHRKANALRNIVGNPPEARIMDFFSFYKKQKHIEPCKTRLEFTRQDIANFTGLRVETVIRKLTKLHREGHIEIRNRKIFI
ncbi:MAG: Crp/Fnr family transcriptional regulator [Saprospiraceae bacterium]